MNIKYFLIPVMLAVFFSCDIVQSDQAPDISNNNQDNGAVYTLPRGIVLIDVVAKNNIDQEATVTLTHLPKKGKAEFHQLGFIQYEADSGFHSGYDMIGYQVSNSSNQVIKEDTVIIIMANDSDSLNCSAYYDKMNVPKETEMVIDVLDNDEVCGNANGDISILLIQSPANGNAEVVNNQILYTPFSGFSGKDQMIYELCLDRDRMNCSKALVDLDIVASTCEFTLVNDTLDYHRSRSDTVFYNLLANDQLCDSTDVSISLENIPQGILTYIENQMLAIHPQQKPSQTVQFVYQVCVKDVFCEKGQVVLNFSEEDCAVNLANDVYDFSNDSTNTTSYRLQVLSNDELCGMDYELRKLQPPSQGSLVVFPDYIEFKPEENQAGEVQFSYEVCYQDECYNALVSISL